MALKIRINGQDVTQNVIFDSVSSMSTEYWQDSLDDIQAGDVTLELNGVDYTDYTSSEKYIEITLDGVKRFYGYSNPDSVKRTFDDTISVQFISLEKIIDKIKKPGELEWKAQRNYAPWDIINIALQSSTLSPYNVQVGSVDRASLPSSNSTSGVMVSPLPLPRLTAQEKTNHEPLNDTEPYTYPRYGWNYRYKIRGAIDGTVGSKESIVYAVQAPDGTVELWESILSTYSTTYTQPQITKITTVHDAKGAKLVKFFRSHNYGILVLEFPTGFTRFRFYPLRASAGDAHIVKSYYDTEDRLYRWEVYGGPKETLQACSVFYRKANKDGSATRTFKLLLFDPMAVGGANTPDVVTFDVYEPSGASDSGVPNTVGRDANGYGYIQDVKKDWTPDQWVSSDYDYYLCDGQNEKHKITDNDANTVTWDSTNMPLGNRYSIVSVRSTKIVAWSGNDTGTIVLSEEAGGSKLYVYGRNGSDGSIDQVVMFRENGLRFTEHNDNRYLEWNVKIDLDLGWGRVQKWDTAGFTGTYRIAYQSYIKSAPIQEGWDEYWGATVPRSLKGRILHNDFSLGYQYRAEDYTGDYTTIPAFDNIQTDDFTRKWDVMNPEEGERIPNQGTEKGEVDEVRELREWVGVRISPMHVEWRYLPLHIDFYDRDKDWQDNEWVGYDYVDSLDRRWPIIANGSNWMRIKVYIIVDAWRGSQGTKAEQEKGPDAYIVEDYSDIGMYHKDSSGNVILPGDAGYLYSISPPKSGEVGFSSLLIGDFINGMCLTVDLDSEYGKKDLGLDQKVVSLSVWEETDGKISRVGWIEPDVIHNYPLDHSHGKVEFLGYQESEYGISSYSTNGSIIWTNKNAALCAPSHSGYFYVDIEKLIDSNKTLSKVVGEMLRMLNMVTSFNPTTEKLEFKRLPSIASETPIPINAGEYDPYTFMQEHERFDGVQIRYRDSNRKYREARYPDENLMYPYVRRLPSNIGITTTLLESIVKESYDLLSTTGMNIIELDYFENGNKLSLGRAVKIGSDTYMTTGIDLDFQTDSVTMTGRKLA